MRITNPATLETIKEIAEDSLATIQDKYQRSRSAQGIWARRGLEERLGIVSGFSELLESQKDELAQTLSLEVGKPLQESYNELAGARKRILFFLEESKKWLSPEVKRVDGNTTDSLAFEPLGVVGNISAWNYPYLVGVNVFVPALIAGNSVMYKPSEFATLTGMHIARLWQEAGLPQGVFSLILGGKEAGEALLELPLNGYFFTGSYKTGRSIAERVSKKLVPVGLELGGKDPLYVTDEVADLRQIAAAVAEGCFYNNGQSCCAVERVYVHEGVYEDFLKHLIAETKKLKVGNPLDKSIQQGAITRPAHVSFLQAQVDEAIKKGAKLVCGGELLKEEGSFYPPTLLTHVTHDMSLMREETFGPVRGVMKVKDDAEAIRLMNDTDYGLTASVYSKNIDRARAILSQVDAGTAYINCCDRVSPYLPWAGRKNSGLGATLSFLGILAFVKSKGWQVRV